MPITDSIQVNKQHAVPQNIMDVEFKLIGDLTMRQFAYLMFFGFLAYVSFAAIPGLFKIPLILFFGLLGLGLAFVPLEERGLDEWIVNFFKAIFMPTQRIWKKEPSPPTAFLYDSIAMVKQELITLAPTSSRRKLEEYLHRQDEQVARDPLDIPEQESVLKVRAMFANMPAIQTAPSSSPAHVGVLVEEPLEEPEFESEEPEQPQVPEEEVLPELLEQPAQPIQSVQTSDVTQQPVVLEPVAEPVLQPAPPVSSTQPMPVQQPISVSQPVPSTQPTPSTPSVQPVQPVEISTPVQSVQPTTPPVSSPSANVVIQSAVKTTPQTTAPVSAGPTPVTPKPKPTQVVRQKPKPRPYVPPKQMSNVTLKVMTPDMHSGRRFTNLLPSSGELILPIRGERIIQTTQDQEIEEDINEKAEKLKLLIEQIKESEFGLQGSSRPAQTSQPATPAPAASPQAQATVPTQSMQSDQTQPTPAPSIEQKPTAPVQADLPEKLQVEEISESAKAFAADVKAQNEKLAMQIAKLKSDISSAKSESKNTSRQEITLNTLEDEKTRLASEYSILSRQITDLQEKLKVLESTPSHVAEKYVSGGYSNLHQIPTTQPLTNHPNVISGVVKDKSGNSVAGTLVLVKNEKGEPVRAMKTNKLGQFVFTTPLANGVYTVEVKTMQENGPSFDIIGLEASGKVIPSTELVEK